MNTLAVAYKRAVGSDLEWDYTSYQKRKKPDIKKYVRQEASPVVKVFAGIATIALLFSLGISYTYLKASKAQLNWRISRLENDIHYMNMNNEKLNLEIARLKSLDRIETMALQMGMVKNPSAQYLMYKIKYEDDSNASSQNTELQKQAENNVEADENMLHKVADAWLNKDYSLKG